MNNPNATAHDLASAYATQVVKRLNLNDDMSVARGDAELVWDLAYDAFMYRTRPTLSSNAKEDGTTFLGGKW